MVTGAGYKTFEAFKRVFGRAGDGFAWHHIVEKTSGNISRFGAEMIHSTNNLIKLPHGAGQIHMRISGFYSSVNFRITGSTLTIRQWLSTKSFQEQYKFGIEAIDKIYKGVWP